MELRYVIITIIKILISVPCIILITTTTTVRAAALMGGYLDNNSNSTNFTISNLYEPFESGRRTDPANVSRSNSSYHEKDDGDFDETMEQQEEIPDPSALVVPGYNLPENIFNKGKPFYLEKDPLTGKVDFDSRTSLLNVEDDEFDYVDGDELYDKANIDRKDGNIGSHKGSDVNQLTPNFHDFLNLPVKYNSDKYVYPLISSSYANTKVQGNLHKYQTMNNHNHKDYSVTTYKPTMSPNHFYTVKTPYYNPNNPVQNPVVPQSTTSTTSTTTTTTTTSTTAAPTTKLINLMDNAMDHLKTEEAKPTEIYLTTSNINDIYLTTKRYSVPPTTTKRTLSLFEQLFGDYEDEYTTTSTTTERSNTPPSLFENLPSNKNRNKYDYPDYVEENTVKSKETEENNVLSGTGMGHESAYDYEDDYSGNIPIKPENVPTSTTSITASTTTSPPKPTTTETTTTLKVTSLPLGENHFEISDYHPPIIAITHNLKEQLNNEKVIPNTSNIHIFPYQDSVSFIVQNHHTPDFIPSVFKEGSFDNGPFKPLIVKSNDDKDTVSYTVNAKPEFIYKPFQKTEVGGSVVRIQPIKTSEASLSIGVPLNEIQKVPGQVVDENIENEDIEFPKTKIVFPEDKESKTSTFGINLQPPPTDREVLQLSSKPMYHQLPSDLTPPNEQDLPRPRPPWDPRPGHFYNGRPEYIRPPRPQLKPTQGEVYKRIDNLPNILPQFRPNVKHFGGGHYFDHYASSKNGYIRQPLLERPSNKPIGFFEKLVPPPPPLKNFNLRKVPVQQQPPPPPPPPEDSPTRKHEQFEFYRPPTPPPQPVLINRRQSDEPTVETLQMIQAKQIEKKETKLGMASSFKTSLKGKESTEKPLYVVYPVNSAPIKLDALETHKKETVVVGTRAELPLPPSKINQEFNYESPQDRNDSPILKPHPKPPSFPIKSDFPYPLERPDITSIASTFPNGNNLDVKEDAKFVQDTESRILTGPKINYKNPNQISVTLKTYTEKPIAVAYTPTEPYRKPANTERYSMPNYASPVISEIRPSGLMDKSGSEITVSAVMHTQPQHQMEYNVQGRPGYENHKSDEDQTPAKLEFQAPFQASLNIDAMSQGWKVVKSDKPKIDRSDDQEIGDTTTVTFATTGDFDMKNFNPQFFSGFKPIYSYPDDDGGKSV